MEFMQSDHLSTGTPPELAAPAREYLLCFSPFLLPLALFDILMFTVRLDGLPKPVMYCNLPAAELLTTLLLAVAYAIRRVAVRRQNRGV